jgi:hypothetical protein
MAPEFKTAGFLTRINLWREELSAQEYQRVLDGLHPSTRALCERPPIGVGWILY